MNTEICKAIREYRLIELRYGWGLRIVQPHAYGLNQNNDELLRCYQMAGASESHQPRDWKLLRLDEVHELRVLEEHFERPMQGYKRGDKALNMQIYCEL